MFFSLGFLSTLGGRSSGSFCPSEVLQLTGFLSAYFAYAVGRRTEDGMKKLALITPLTSILPPAGNCIFMALWGVGIGTYFAANQSPPATSMGTYTTAVSVTHWDRAGRRTSASSSLRCRSFVIVEDFTLFIQFIHVHILPRLRN